MVSRPQEPQDSTMLPSSGASASHSSGSSTAVEVEPEPSTANNKSAFHLLRRSRKSVAGKMKLSNLFRSSNPTSTTTGSSKMPTVQVPTDDGNGPTPIISTGNDNATISSVIVTMDTTVEEKQQQQQRDVMISNSTTTTTTTAVWMESLYHNEIPAGDDSNDCMVVPVVVVDGDNDAIVTTSDNNPIMASTTPNTREQSPLPQSTAANTTNIVGVPTTSKGTRTITTGPLFCSDTEGGVPFFDQMCHMGGRTIDSSSYDDSEETIQRAATDKQIKQSFHNRLPDDPSIQESIECVFMAQHESMYNEQQQHNQQKQQQQQQKIVDTTSTVLNNRRWSEQSVSQNDDHRNSNYSRSQTPPSTIHQSLLKNRSISRLPIQFQRDVISRSPRSSSMQQPQQHHGNYNNNNNMFQQRIPPPDKNITIAESRKNDPIDLTSELHETTNSPTTSKQLETTTSTTGTASTSTSLSCTCCHRQAPLLQPDDWPQRPLLLRPTPNSGTRITGIRFVASADKYLWRADENNDNDSNNINSTTSQPSSLTWPQALREHWAKDTDASRLPPPPKPASPNVANTMTTTMCSQCMIMPINNGKELPGESLVSDFESELFIGTILVRLKDSHGTTIPNYREQSNGGYFHNLHRRYQVVIRGRFKQSLPWTECITGFQLEHPCGKLPPKWIVNGALNIVRFFAPQLQTNVTCPRPYSLTPLGSTPQSLIVYDMDPTANDDDDDATMSAKLFTDRMRCDVSMEVPQEEPRIDTSTLIGHASNASSSMQRARYRKKHFDKMYSEAHHHHHTTSHDKHPSNKSIIRNDGTLYTDPSKVYTFEFLQHLLSFDDFTIELGSIVGSVQLETVLHGQPLQIMSSYQSPTPLLSKSTTTTAQPPLKAGRRTATRSSLSDSSNTTNTLLQNRFWCFDIWHEILYADAKKYDEEAQQQHQNGMVVPLNTTLSHEHQKDDVFCNQMTT